MHVVGSHPCMIAIWKPRQKAIWRQVTSILSFTVFFHRNIHPKLLIGKYSLVKAGNIIHFFYFFFLDSSNLMVDEQTSTNTRRPDYKTDVYESYEFAYTTNLGKLKPTKTYHLQTKLLIFIELL